MGHTVAIRMFLLIMAAMLLSLIIYSAVRPGQSGSAGGEIQVAPVERPWRAPAFIPPGDAGREIEYGRKLIVNTSYYLGPKGSVARIANNLNCQNCHLDAGTRPWAGNFGAVASTFPKYRSRSGTQETIEKRINDCFERSMNGRPPDSASREMRAMVAYLTWVGKDVPKGKAPLGSGLIKVPYLERAADPVRGRKVYVAKCARCHGDKGQGLLLPGSSGYLYPPLWGEDSYNTAAGLYRLGTFASFVKYNMPYGVTFIRPELSDEEAWDVAAYVNSRPRPVKNFAGDWPDIAEKPVDHPFGPYADGFSEEQHKYGPFKPIVAARKTIAGGSRVQAQPR